MVDVLIAGGWVLDGTGSAALVGLLLWKGTGYAFVRGSTDELKAPRDCRCARDKMVAPGFIDVHTHSYDSGGRAA